MAHDTPQAYFTILLVPAVKQQITAILICLFNKQFGPKKANGSKTKIHRLVTIATDF